VWPPPFLVGPTSASSPPFCAAMISVIVPVYNAGRYLERVMAALLSQDYPSEAFELIFVDNGSTDNSRSILDREPRIRVLSVAERGSYVARNRGVRESRGDILAFTDSDCYPVKGWLSAIQSAFERPATQIVLGPRVPAVNRRSVRLVSDYENSKTELVCASNDPMLYFGHTNNMAVQRAAMDRFGPFVERPRAVRIRSSCGTSSTNYRAARCHIVRRCASSTPSSIRSSPTMRR
jgi:glycosyltransferase involved in cell wall biosynthesis